MTARQHLTRLVQGLQKTANIVAVTILVIASVVTWDLRLLAMGAATEGLYVVIYSLWPTIWARYKTMFRAEGELSKANPERSNFFTQYLLSPPLRSRVTFLDGVLLVVTVIGFVVIFFFGFGKHLLSHPLPTLTHAEGWDTGALIWTGFFLFYYTFKFQFSKVGILDKAFVVFITWFSLPFLFLAWYFMDKPIIHVLFVWLIGVCFLVVDSLVIKYHPDPEEKDLSRASRKWADWPMVISFAVLMGYLMWHRDTEHKDVFVSGVVASQLLISNAVFVVMEFGFLRPAHSAVLRGLVQDVSGAVIADAILTARSFETNLSQTTTSDRNGRFQFLNLPAGKLDVVVDAAGFMRQSRQVALTVGQTDSLLLRLVNQEGKGETPEESTK